MKARAYLFGPEADRSKVRERVLRKSPKAMVQAVRPDAAPNSFVVEMIAAQTIEADETGGLLAKRAEIDFLLRLAGTAQIEEALRLVGARRGEGFVLVVATPDGTANPKVLGGRPVEPGVGTAEDFARVEKAALLSAGRV